MFNQYTITTTVFKDPLCKYKQKLVSFNRGLGGLVFVYSSGDMTLRDWILSDCDELSIWWVFWQMLLTWRVLFKAGYNHGRLVAEEIYTCPDPAQAYPLSYLSALGVDDSRVSHPLFEKDFGDRRIFEVGEFFPADRFCLFVIALQISMRSFFHSGEWSVPLIKRKAFQLAHQPQQLNPVAKTVVAYFTCRRRSEVPSISDLEKRLIDYVKALKASR